jgi:hypothetical protein
MWQAYCILIGENNMKKVAKKSSVIQLPTIKTYVAMNIQDYILCFFGPPGVGKTTFVDETTDNTLFISTDRGTRFRKMLRKEVHNRKELLEAVVALESGQHKKYNMVCLDHIDDICNMLEEAVCKKFGIEDLGDLEWSKGYKMFKKDLWSIMQRLLKLSTGLSFIAHEDIKPVTKSAGRKVDKIRPDMGRSAWKILIPKCDMVGYCGFGKGNVRIIRTMPTSHIYAKDRTRRLKPKTGCEFLDGKKFAMTFRKGKSA